MVVLGVGLLALLYVLPSTPSSVETDNMVDQSEEVTDQTTSSQVSNESLSPEAQVDEALAMLESGAPPMQAILKIRQVAEDYPGNVKANFTLGVMSIQTGQYDKAVGRFQTVLESEPNNIDALRLLAKAFAGAGNMDSAKEQYAKALEVATEDSLKATIQKELNELSNN